MVYIPMAHGLYNGSGSIQIPWVMDCTVVYVLHGSWIVQWLRQCADSMGHGLYGSISTPWVMDCTVVDLPMTYGLYNRVYAPWVMDCTTVYPLHGSWAVQKYIYPWPMDCTMVQAIYRPHRSWTVQ